MVTIEITTGNSCEKWRADNSWGFRQNNHPDLIFCDGEFIRHLPSGQYIYRTIRRKHPKTLISSLNFVDNNLVYHLGTITYSLDKDEHYEVAMGIGKKRLMLEGGKNDNEHDRSNPRQSFRGIKRSLQV